MHKQPPGMTGVVRLEENRKSESSGYVLWDVLRENNNKSTEKTRLSER